MKKQHLKAIICSAICAIMLCSVYGCGDKRNVADNGDQTLETYVWDAGYGNDWLKATLEDFGTLDWVKEKYPNYKYATVINDQNNFGESRVGQGKNNTIDLFFTESVEAYFGTDVLLDLTECLYNSKVPGEDVLYKDKMVQSLYECCKYVPVGSNEPAKFYMTPGSMGMGGIVYNSTLLEELGLTVPNTTDEMFALMEDVKQMGGKNPEYPKTYTMISSNIPYIGYMYPVWWAQYEGSEQYANYWKAINYEGTKNSIDVLSQKGRLESLKIFQRIYNENNGYYDRSSSTYEFIAGQTRLLLREGLFMGNGDWFSNEMKELAAEYKKMGYNDVVRMMKTPIVSSIVEKTPSIVATATAESKTNDEILSYVIAEIDAGKTTSEKTSITQADFDLVKEARGIIYSGSIVSTTVIPSAATAKDLAVDFLRYLATDRANEIYASNTSGGRLPFNYNLKIKNPELYNKFMSEQKESFQCQADCTEILSTSYSNILPYMSSFPLCKYGGLSYVTYEAASGNGIDGMFIADKNLTAQKVFDETIKFYSENNGARWQRALQDAGLN